MKTLYILFIGLIVSGGVMAQSCLPEGITFETQAQIDSFQIIYPNCTEIEGGVYISGEGWTDITNLDSLNVLTSIGGGLVVEFNDCLTSLTGLEGLTSIGGDVWIGGYNWWGGNLTLTSLTGLEGLTFIGGDLTISNNPALSTCDVQSICDYLVSPNGTIEIHDNATGCNSQQEVEEACDALPCLPDGIYFATQAQIDSFQINNPNCSEIEGDVIISGNDITNLNGLTVLTSIGGNLIIGNINLGWNPALTSLTGLENLTSIGGSLIIDGNEALTSLTGLDNVTYIGGALVIGDWQEYQYNALTSLTGLDNVTYIGDYVLIKKNEDLTSLTGLENVTSIGGDLTISNNAALSTCDVQSICDYLVSPNGTIEIHDNATGCNSQEEVEEACTTGLDDISNLNNHITIYPNPSSTQITVELPHTPQKNTFLTIYNLNGQKLITQPITDPQTVVDVSGLPKGVYFVKVKDDEKVMMGKVVKE